MKIYDVIVVGSGPAGVHSVYPLIKKGLKVAIVDCGLIGKNVLKKTDGILKIKSNIKINQSLAKGGLSEIWPGICDYFNRQELSRMGLPTEEILKEYKQVARLISLNPKPFLDTQSRLILRNRHVYRLPIAYPYRTSQIVEKFKENKSFEYLDNLLVYNVADQKKFVEVAAHKIDSDTKIYLRSKYLILAAGSINTTRILLQSTSLYNKKVPFLTKVNYMFVCFQPKLLMHLRKKSNSFSQVAISDDNYFIQFYKCNPQSFQKALPYIRLPKNLTLFLLKIFARFLMIADLRFETSENDQKFLKLKRSKQGEFLEISFHLSDRELENHQKKVKDIRKFLPSLGLWPIRILKGDVTSHYAGGVSSMLNKSKRVYIADSSTWQVLPAKPPTLTIMANARMVGKQVLKKF